MPIQSYYPTAEPRISVYAWVTDADRDYLGVVDLTVRPLVDCYKTSEPDETPDEPGVGVNFTIPCLQGCAGPCAGQRRVEVVIPETVLVDLLMRVVPEVTAGA